MTALRKLGLANISARSTTAAGFSRRRTRRRRQPHKAFREAARSVARLYDIAAAPENRELMTFTSPKTGQPVLRAFQIPKTHADLRERRLFSEKWAEATFGLMGRTPDHVAGFFTAMRACRSVRQGRQKFADNVVAFYEKMRDEHLYVSYAIVPPQIDRSKPAHKQTDPALYAGVVKERDDGIRDLGRAATRDRRRAVRLAAPELHPPAAAGRRELRQLSRGADQCAGPEALSAPAVRAPRRQRVRLIRCPAGSTSPTATWCSTTCSCPGSTSSSIATSKSPATSGGRPPPTRSATIRRRCATSPSCASWRVLAQRMNEMTGNVAAPAGAGDDGRARRLRDDLRIHAAGAGGRGADQERRAVAVNHHALFGHGDASRNSMAGCWRWSASWPAARSSPCRRRFPTWKSPQTAPDVERYMRSASTDAKSRIALMRLLWDFLGSEFGSRHQQYEKFYGGASFVVKTNVFRNFDWKRAGGLVDAALALPPLAD
jgi:4-hydroxyphenylacetate 3-monooxygenase